MITLHWTGPVDPGAQEMIRHWLWSIYAVRVEWTAADRCELHGERAQEAHNDVQDAARDAVGVVARGVTGGVVGEA